MASIDEKDSTTDIRSLQIESKLVFWSAGISVFGAPLLPLVFIIDLRPPAVISDWLMTYFQHQIKAVVNDIMRDLEAIIRLDIRVLALTYWANAHRRVHLTKNSSSGVTPLYVPRPHVEVLHPVSLVEQSLHDLTARAFSQCEDIQAMPKSRREQLHNEWKKTKLFESPTSLPVEWRSSGNCHIMLESSEIIVIARMYDTLGRSKVQDPASGIEFTMGKGPDDLPTIGTAVLKSQRDKRCKTVLLIAIDVGALTNTNRKCSCSRVTGQEHVFLAAIL